MEILFIIFYLIYLFIGFVVIVYTNKTLTYKVKALDFYCDLSNREFVFSTIAFIFWPVAILFLVYKNKGIKK